VSSQRENSSRDREYERHRGQAVSTITKEYRNNTIKKFSVITLELQYEVIRRIFTRNKDEWDSFW